MDSIVNDAIDQAEEAADRAAAPATEQASRGGTMTDEQLREVLGELETEITVIGCGGAG